MATWARMRRRVRWRVYVIPVCALLAFALPSLRGGDFKVDTGTYSAIALQAFREGSLWSLWLGDIPYYNKPPLPFWIHGLSLWLFGPEMWAVRLPVVLVAAACTAATVGLARVYCSRRTALVTGLVLALTMEFFRHTRQFSLDIWQALFLIVAVWMCAAGEKRGRGWMIALAGVPIGLALMVKPMMALAALPLLAVWLVWIGRARLVGWLLGAGVIALAVAAPWHVSMALVRGEGFVNEYFGRQTIGRGIGTAFVNEAWWEYGKILGRTYWPWMVAVVMALFVWARSMVGARGGSGRAHGLPFGTSRGTWGLARDARAERLAIVWTFAWLIAMSCFADKRSRYLMPVYPTLAWLSAMWMVRWSPRWMRRAKMRWVDGVAVIGAGCAAVFAMLPLSINEPPAEKWGALYAFLREQGAGAEVWNGSLDRGEAARVYLNVGVWPRTTVGSMEAMKVMSAAESLRGWGSGDGADAGPRSGAIVLYEERSAPVVERVRGEVVFERDGLVGVRVE